MKETGCGAVKLEGGTRMAETIRFLVERGIPVMGHVGLTPQALQHDRRLQGAGPGRGGRATGSRPTHAPSPRPAPSPSCSRRWSSRSPARSPPALAVPTIGIGASPACDGQILVLEDMLGLSPRVPKFVKRYGSLAEHIEAAVGAYAGDVRVAGLPGRGTRLQAEDAEAGAHSVCLQGL